MNKGNKHTTVTWGVLQEASGYGKLASPFSFRPSKAGLSADKQALQLHAGSRAKPCFLALPQHLTCSSYGQACCQELPPGIDADYEVQNSNQWFK